MSLLATFTVLGTQTLLQGAYYVLEHTEDCLCRTCIWWKHRNAWAHLSPILIARFPPSSKALLETWRMEDGAPELPLVFLVPLPTVEVPWRLGCSFAAAAVA